MHYMQNTKEKETKADQDCAGETIWKKTQHHLDWHWGEQWTWQRTDDDGDHSL